MAGASPRRIFAPFSAGSLFSLTAVPLAAFVLVGSGQAHAAAAASDGPGASASQVHALPPGHDLAAPPVPPGPDRAALPVPVGVGTSSGQRPPSGSDPLAAVSPIPTNAFAVSAPTAVAQAPGPATSAQRPSGDAATPQGTPPGARPAGASAAEPAQGSAPQTPASPTPATEAPPSEVPAAQPPAAESPAAQPPASEPQATNEPRVPLSEVAVEGLERHPEQQRLEQAVYGAMTVTPGSQVTRSQLRKDLAAIYATGWFSDVRMTPKDGPLGVRLVVSVVPNPVLTKVSLEPADAKVPATVVEETFAADYGRTLNLNTLQTRIQALQRWYSDQGYSLARITGPGPIGADGSVQLLVRQGTVTGVDVQFLDKEGSTTDDKGRPIKGKTKIWVITREISLKSGDIFNRRNLEDDIKRLYATGLFSDVKVSLRPDANDPGRIAIVLGVVEQSTGSLSGGLGYSQSQGVFGQVQVQDSNLLGRAWDVATSFTYGQFGGLFDITFTDPWIKGDPFRTAFRLKAFISRDVPQVFQSQDNGNIYTVSDFYEAPGTSIDGRAYNINSSNNPAGRSFGSVDKAEDDSPSTSWFDYDGNSVVVQRVGGNFQFIRPLNGGNPFKRAPWSVVLGFNAQQVTPMNVGGDSMPFGVVNNDFTGSSAPLDSVVCVAYNCANQNQLVGLRLATTYNSLDDPRNPTRGNFLSLGTEQFISVGPDSPTFNRVRGSFTHFIPVNWLKFYKGCRAGAKSGDCRQALAFQVSAGTVLGDLPPYEAFCLGGGNSVRGYYDCDLGVGKSFGEATIEYRFPLFSIVSGEIFLDGGTTFGTQNDVPGNLGSLLGKPGEGFSVGTGVIVTTPVGPLRLEVASQDLTSNWRFNLGVGWKF